jgi:hypothetical protein
VATLSIFGRQNASVIFTCEKFTGSIFSCAAVGKVRQHAGTVMINDANKFFLM